MCAVDAPCACRPHWWGRPIPLTLALAVLIGGSYSAYERVGTAANAEFVEFSENYGGGFLALGMTETEPGFVVLSALGRSQVQIRADLANSPAAGRHTVASVVTPKARWEQRLRDPQIVLVDESGQVQSWSSDLTLEEFRSMRRWIDCEHPAMGKTVHRCGAPFADLHDLLAEWDAGRMPEPVRKFLSYYAVK